MSAAAILTADAQRRDLEYAPITSAHVIDGAPVARSVQLTESTDGRCASWHG